MTDLRDRDSSPDMRLVELTCARGHTSVPSLQRSSMGQLAAYCTAEGPVTELDRPPRICGVWIKWVPQTERWLSLEEWQKATNLGPIESPPDVKPLPEFEATTRTYFRQAITGIARFCNDQAIAMGFLDRERSLGDMLTLINTEMSELFEAFRHGTSDNPSDHIPDFTQREEEWADIGVRWFCHAVEDGVDPDRLGAAFVTKLQFNRTRGYRHGGKRV